MIRGVHLAQVTDVHPESYEVSVILPNLAHAEGVRVKLTGERQHPVAGDYQLPERFDWGIVVFVVDDIQAGFWLRSISDRHRHLIPSELLLADPFARLEHHPSDSYTIEHGDGTLERVWPDGSVLKITTSKDGSMSNVGRRQAVTPRYRTLSPAYGQPGERQPYQGRPQPPVDVDLLHSSGARVAISADGSVRLTTPQGHQLSLHDGTEKVRAADYPHGVIATPEEDAARVNSRVTLASEIGHALTLHDDPINEADRYVTVGSAKGHQLELRDKPDPQSGLSLTTVDGHRIHLHDGGQHLTIETAGGHTLVLHDDEQYIAITSAGGRSMQLDDAAQVTTIQDPAKVVVLAPQIHLGGEGGRGVARVNDTVAAGTITSGSSQVFAT